MTALLPSRAVCHSLLKLATLWAVLAFLAIATACLHGCAATPARQAYIGVAGATDAVNGVSDAFQAGLLTRADLEALVPYADAVKVAQDDLDKAILSRAVDLSAYWRGLTDAVLALLNEQARRRHPLAPPAPPAPLTPPTTRPNPPAAPLPPLLTT